MVIEPGLIRMEIFRGISSPSSLYGNFGRFERISRELAMRHVVTLRLLAIWVLYDGSRQVAAKISSLLNPGWHIYMESNWASKATSSAEEEVCESTCQWFGPGPGPYGIKPWTNNTKSIGIAISGSVSILTASRIRELVESRSFDPPYGFGAAKKASR